MSGHSIQRGGGVQARAARLATGWLVAVLLIAAPAAAGAQDKPFLDRAESSRSRGDVDAPVVVFEIADFECPYCARFFRQIFPRIAADYIETGKVRWIFVNLPLPTHRRAWGAAKAALCAGAIDDRFWPMHDRILGRQTEWTGADDPTTVFVRYAAEVGLDADAFLACLNDDRVAPILVADVIFAVRAGVTGTPAYIIEDGAPVLGLKTFEEWQALLEDALEAAGRRSR